MQSTQDTIFNIARIQILTKRRNKIIFKNILLFIRNSLLQKYTKACNSFEFFIFPFMIQVLALCMSVHAMHFEHNSHCFIVIFSEWFQHWSRFEWSSCQSIVWWCCWTNQCNVDGFNQHETCVGGKLSYQNPFAFSFENRQYSNNHHGKQLQRISIYIYEAYKFSERKKNHTMQQQLMCKCNPVSSAFNSIPRQIHQAEHSVWRFWKILKIYQIIFIRSCCCFRCIKCMIFPRLYSLCVILSI